MRKRRMPNKWTEYSDAQSRLHGSVVFYDDVPYIALVHSPAVITLTSLISQQPIKDIDYKDPLLDVSTPELGYANIDTHDGPVVRYFSRSPKKRWKQGIDNQSLNVTDLIGHEAGPVVKTPHGKTSYMIQTPGFAAMLLGSYPEIYTDLPPLLENGKCTEVAFSKSIAVNTSSSGVALIYYRQENVGHVTLAEGITLRRGRSSQVVREELVELKAYEVFKDGTAIAA